MCVKCEQYHVNDIRSTGHNVVIISEKEYEGKEDIHSKYIDENATIKRQQYREIIHTIRSDTILRRRFILKEIKNDINTCHTQTYDVQSEMQNVAQNMKDMLDNWIRKIDSPHRCLNKKKELEFYKDLSKMMNIHLSDRFDFCHFCHSLKKKAFRPSIFI